MSSACWKSVKERFEALSKVDETFAAWVRRMLLEARP